MENITNTPITFKDRLIASAHKVAKEGASLVRTRGPSKHSPKGLRRRQLARSLRRDLVAGRFCRIVLGHLPHPIVTRAESLLDRIAADLTKINGVEVPRKAPSVKMTARRIARNQLKRERRAARSAS